MFSVEVHRWLQDAEASILIVAFLCSLTRNNLVASFRYQTCSLLLIKIEGIFFFLNVYLMQVDHILSDCTLSVVAFVCSLALSFLFCPTLFSNLLICKSSF